MGGTWHELIELTRVRVLLFVREPEAMFWVLVFPVVLAGVLGYAFRDGEVAASRVAVLAGDGDAALMELLRRDPLIEVEEAPDPAAAKKRLRSGAIDLLISPDDDLRARLNPERPEAETARLRILAALARVDDPSLDERMTVEPVTEEGSRYVDFLFPGLLGMNLMGTGIWGIGFAIADQRQRKLLKRLRVTPTRRSSFLLSFMLSRFVFLAMELIALLLFAVFLLDVPIYGSVAALLVVSTIGTLAFAGLGLLIAARPRTIEGVSGIMNFVMMPMWLASGVFFSYERFPEFDPSGAPGAAADRAERRAAGDHARRRPARVARAGAAGPRRVGRRHVPRRGARVSMGLSHPPIHGPRRERFPRFQR